ncbi:putative microsomal glutathione S-transferase 1 [Scophthalmus maximus]|uniref:Microsomal glutathione S-transferase 1 n=2 Tax=Scophthalmus maximus TaxID=52904 RepID=A0A2U9BAG4_SCOMX|nr:microsomal glutathione S-transferase 1 [Scophthalmus maximus]AWP00947.1 putative microsomal glutathione S-transferase 1 [Scophthalmus maximus]
MEVPVYNTPEANSETKQCYSRSGLLPHITQPQDEFQAFLSNWSLDLSLLFTVTMLKQGTMSPLSSVMESQVLQAFSTYAIIVILKMMLMSPLTSYFRLTRKVFANLEDTKFVSSEADKKLVRTDPDVERVRRCHLNDLENIVPFVAVGLLYALTGPELSSALLHFRLFAGSRILHTVAYVGALPQPSRGLSWILGMLVTFSMAYRVLSTVLLL